MNMKMDRRKKSILELTRISAPDYKKRGKLPLMVMADNVRSAQNIGAIMRTCDAFLIKEMIMTGISAVPPSREISKTSLGAEESVGWRYAEDPLQETIALKNKGVRIIVLEQTHNSIPLQDIELEDGIEYMLVVGNEVCGVNQKIVDLADYVVEIPMHGIKHSLNVAVSAGITLWQLYTQLKCYCL